jgi:hypothetical protein
MAAPTREELEALDRDTLIQAAERVGVKRARIMTRPELVDEILLARAENRAEVKKARGFFGMARDLLFRAVERGLNLPDAAERFRGTPSPSRPARASDAIPTVTLAEIYAAQGHTAKAIETVRGVLEREPDHAAAHTLLAQLEDSAYAAPKPPDLPPEVEPRAFDDEEDEDAVAEEKASEKEVVEEHTNGVGEERGTDVRARIVESTCVAVPTEDRIRVAWSIDPRMLDHYRALAPRAQLALRVAVITPTTSGPRKSFRDIAIGDVAGEYVVSGLPPRIVTRVAVGMLDAAAFAPIAHSPAVEREGAQLYIWTPKGREAAPESLSALAS